MKPFQRVALALFALQHAACGDGSSDDGGSLGTGGSGGAGTGGEVAGTGAVGVGGVVGGTGGAASGGAGVGGGAASGGTASGGSASGLPGFYVDGRHLYDRCGEQVVLRGVNEMIVWSGGQDGVPEFAEIAKTGANAVRIVWTIADGTAAGLDTAITNAVAQDLIPMVELHDATGDLSKLPSLVTWWTQADVVAVIKKHEQYLLLNIGNEVGASEQADPWESAYETAITSLRDAGIRTPLIIDGPQWGQDIDMLQNKGPALIEHDPDHNLLFSVHMWWNDPNGTRVTNEIQQSVSMSLPLIVGEFAQHAVSNCSAEPFDYDTLLTLAQTNQIGWLAWSWGSVKNNDCKDDGPFDMTTNGTFAGLSGWGLDVATTHEASIKNTSVRPASMTSGTCN
jgi:mannan endo-1,4-beta-mannosidase